MRKNAFFNVSGPFQVNWGGRGATGNPYLRGRLSTVDLHVLHAFDIANIIYFFTMQAALMRRPTVLWLPLHLVFPGHQAAISHR
jgi:hypothetical protein